MVESLNKLRLLATYVFNYLWRDKFLLILTILLLIFIVVIPGFIQSIPKFIDWNTLCLIVFYIILSRAFIVSGLIDNLALRLVKISNDPYKLYFLVIFTTVFVSFIATNDGAVLIMTPLVLSISRFLGKDYKRLVIIVLLAANTGSILLPFSNPQNIIIWQHYELSMFSIIMVTAPLVTILLTVLLFVTFIWVHKEKPWMRSSVILPRIKIKPLLAYSSVTLLILGTLLGEYRYGVLALLIEVIVLLLIDRRVFKGVDYGLILIFVLIFPIFRELSLIITKHYRISLYGLTLYIVSIGLSQIISNVPATIALISYTNDWKTLLIGVNIAGYVSPIGSLANMIGLRISGMKVMDYIRYSYLYIIFAIGLGIVISLFI